MIGLETTWKLRLGNGFSFFGYSTHISMFLFIIFIGGLKQPSLFKLRFVYKHSPRQTFTIQGMIRHVLDP